MHAQILSLFFLLLMGYSGGCGSPPEGKEQIEIARLLTNQVKLKMN
jgi:hypothetical protein